MIQEDTHSDCVCLGFNGAVCVRCVIVGMLQYKRVGVAYFVEISMAICTDFMRLSLMWRSTGSML